MGELFLQVCDLLQPLLGLCELHFQLEHFVLLCTELVLCLLQLLHVCTHDSRYNYCSVELCYSQIRLMDCVLFQYLPFRCQLCCSGVYRTFKGRNSTLSTAALASRARLSCLRMSTISDCIASREAAASLATASRLATLLSFVPAPRGVPALSQHHQLTLKSKLFLFKACYPEIRQ